MLTVIMRRPGHENYLCSDPCLPLLHLRLGKKAKFESIPFGEKHKIGNATVSFHPAGHILGSAQVRIEVSGRVVVISGDYKPDGDRTCEEFEPVKCHDFISECTFGLPVYRWKPEELVFDRINQWWSTNAGEKNLPSSMLIHLEKLNGCLPGLTRVLVRSFSIPPPMSFWSPTGTRGSFCLRPKRSKKESQ